MGWTCIPVTQVVPSVGCPNWLQPKGSIWASQGLKNLVKPPIGRLGTRNQPRTQGTPKGPKFPFFFISKTLMLGVLAFPEKSGGLIWDRVRWTGTPPHIPCGPTLDTHTQLFRNSPNKTLGICASLGTPLCVLTPLGPPLGN